MDESINISVSGGNEEIEEPVINVSSGDSSDEPAKDTHVIYPADSSGENGTYYTAVIEAINTQNTTLQECYSCLIAILICSGILVGMVFALGFAALKKG